MRSSSKRSSSLPRPSSPKKQKKEGSLAASPADMELDSGRFHPVVLISLESRVNLYAPEFHKKEEALYEH